MVQKAQASRQKAQASRAVFWDQLTNKIVQWQKAQASRAAPLLK